MLSILLRALVALARRPLGAHPPRPFPARPPCLSPSVAGHPGVQQPAARRLRGGAAPADRGRRAKKDTVQDRVRLACSPEPARRLLPAATFPSIRHSVPASLRPSTDRASMQMPTSTGALREMRRVGTLEFTVKGQPLKLTAFVDVGERNLDHLFVPFTDLTTGTETYPGGRYLDLDRNTTGIYVIDFNRAYHPTCYYNPTWDCPYPPAENRLKTPIRAGERLKKEEVKG